MLFLDVLIFGLLELVLISYIWIKLTQKAEGFNHSIRKNNVYLNIYSQVRIWCVPVSTFLTLIIFVLIFKDSIKSNLFLCMVLVPVLSVPIGAFIGSILSDHLMLKHNKQMMKR